LSDNFKPASLSSIETGVNPRTRSVSTEVIELDFRKPLVVSISHKSEELGLLQPGLEFDNFKPLLKSGSFKCISWLNGSFFLWVLIRVL
jgi:hypothetical protein